MRALGIAACAGIAASGVLLMARGASREAGGRLGDARRLGRRGGLVALAGAVALAAVASRPGASGAALAAGAIALLGGLSGKPRPAWWLAAAVLALAIALTL